MPLSSNQGCGVGVGVGVGVGRSRRFSEGVGVGVGVGLSSRLGVGVGLSSRLGVGVGLSSRLGVGVGVGIFYPTPTPHVQFLFVLVMLTAQLTRPRANGMQCSNLFKRTLPRIARHSVRLIKSLHFNL